MIPNVIAMLLNQIMPGFKDLQNASSPDELAQKLLNSGKVNQEQVNRARQMWNQPNIRQMVENKFKF